MKKRVIIGFSILVLLLGSLLYAQEAPQQSTTGPEPPAGVKPAEKDDRPLKITDKQLTVPGYAWRHGCGPTAVGMVIGYYDGNGFPDLVSGDTSTQTTEVDQMIASQDSSSNPQHYEDYSLPDDTGQSSPLADKSEAPAGDEHASNCVADFAHTSWSADGNFYGWSWSNMMGPGFENYVELVSTHEATYTDYYPTTISFSVLQTEIDADRPMVLLVDSDGDGGTDHFVTAVGYRTSSGYDEYGCLDTWFPYETIRWERFRDMSSSYAWGVWGGTTFSITTGVNDWNLY